MLAALNVLAPLLRRLHWGRVLAAVHELLKPLRVKPDHEIVAMGDHGNSHTAAQSAPISQRLTVFRDVQLLELAVPLLEPILGLNAVVSAGDRVDSDDSHGRHSFSLGCGG